MSDRDTHFQQFAKLLWDELVEANGYGYIDVSADDDGISPTDYRTIIARRAYDLAVYVTDHVRGAISRDPEFVLKYNVPDMTALPEDEQHE